MTTYPLSLSLQNFMPVLLSAAALWNLVRMLAHDGAAPARAAAVAALLIVAGGAMKALWKLAMTLWNIDAPLLSQSLFPLIAPGFGMLALALLRPTTRGIFAGALLIGAAASSALLIAAAGASMWKMPLLALLTGAMVACAVGLVRRARAGRDLLSIALVLLYTVTSFGLSGLAAAGARTLALQWTEQLVSTLGAAALLWAAVRMQRAVRNSETNT